MIERENVISVSKIRAITTQNNNLLLGLTLSATLAYFLLTDDTTLFDTQVWYAGMAALLSTQFAVSQGMRDLFREGVSGPDRKKEKVSFWRSGGLLATLSRIKSEMGKDNESPAPAGPGAAEIIDLPRYRNKVYFWFSVLVIISMIPLSINNFIQGRMVMCFVSTAVGLVYIVNVAVMRLRGSDGINMLFTIVPVMAALPVAVHQMGVVGVFWSYTGVVLVSFILPSRSALTMNLLLLTMVSPMIFFKLPLMEATRAFLTLGLVAACTRIFAKVIETQQEELSALIVTDQLTGAYNRFRMEEEIINSVSKKTRYETTTSAMAIDIDHFKKLNDNRGHLAGDKALKELVRVIRDRLRLTDMIFRYGGEEFIVLLPETDRGTASALAEKIRQLVSGADIIDGWPLTISIGVTEVLDSDTRDCLLGRIDTALYDAKGRGRNIVVTV